MTRIGPKAFVAGFRLGKFPGGATASGQRVMDPVNDVIDEYMIVSVEEDLNLMLLHQALNPGLFSGVRGARAAASVAGGQGVARVAPCGMMHAHAPEPLRRALQCGFEPVHLRFAPCP